MHKKLWLLIWLFSVFVVAPAAQGAITLRNSGFSSIGAPATGGALTLRATMGQPAGGTGNQQVGFWSAVTPLSQPATTPGQPTTPGDGGVAPPPQVVGQPPKAQNPITPQKLTVGDAPFTQDLSGVFVDPDGDAITITSASSSDPKVVTTTLQGANLTATPVGAGSATITITAKDPAGNFGSSAFVALVTEPTAPANQVPTVANAIGDQNLTAKGAPFVRDLNVDPKVFADGDGDNLAFVPSTSDAGIAKVVLSGTSITVTPVSEGTATITVTASDPKGGAVAMTFKVNVAAPPPENKAPVIASAIGDQILIIGEAAFVRDLNVDPKVFTDPDNNPLTYGVVSNDESVASVRLSGSTVTVTPVTPGEATILIVADDKRGGRAETRFKVTSKPKPVQAPVAVISTLGTSGTAPFTVQFEDKSTNNPTGRTWNFGDGGTSGDATVSHTYNDPGAYTVTLTAENDGGSHSVTVRILVEKPFEPPPIEEPAPLVLAESFVDIDPGFGRGRPIQVTTSSLAEARFDVQTQSLEPGFHTLFVRFKDQRGNWGFARGSQFYVAPVADGVVFPLVKLEYFFDGNDPGVGSALGIEIARAQTLSGDYEIDFGNLASGAHTITMRAQNANGEWGLGVLSSFEVNEKGQPLPPLVLRSLAERSFTIGDDPLVLDLNADPKVFSDPNGDALTFTASSSDQKIASVQVSGSVVTITPVGAGRAAITLRADDGSGVEPVATALPVLVNPGLLSVALGSSIDGQLKGTDDSQFVAFKLDKTTDIVIDVIPQTEMDVTFTLFRGHSFADVTEENILSDDIDVGGKGGTESFTTQLDPGNYLLGILSFENAGSYTMRLREFVVPELVLGDQIKGSFLPGDSEQAIKLTLNSATDVDFSLVPTEGLDASLYIYRGIDPTAENFVRVIDPGFSGEPDQDVVSLTEGTYTLFVNIESGSGDYVLTAKAFRLPAIALNETVTGTFGRISEQNIYRLNVKEEKQVRISFAHTDSLSAFLDVYRGSGLNDLISDNSLLGGEVVGFDRFEDDPTYFLPTGDYLFVFSPFVDPKPYTLKVEEFVFPSLALGSSTSGTFAYSNQTKYSVLTIQDSTLVSFQFETQDSLAAELSIFRGNNLGDVAEENRIGDIELVGFEIGGNAPVRNMPPGQYVVEVYGLNAGAYNMLASGTDPRPILPTLTLGKTIESVLSNVGERQYFTFQVGEETQNMIVSLTSDAFDARLSIYAANTLSDTANAQIANIDFTGSGAEVYQTSFAPGTYILEASEYADSEVGAFTVGLQATTSGKISTGETKTGELTFSNERQYFAVTFEDSVTVSVDLSSDAMDPYVEFLAGETIASATLLSQNDDIGNENFNARIENVVGPGNYWVAVSGFAPGAYTLRVETKAPLPVAAVTQLAIGASTEGVIGKVGDRAYFRFDVTDKAQALTVDMDAPGFDGRMVFYASESLRDTSNVRVAEIDYTIVGIEGFNALFEPGSYIVEISEYADLGSGTFSIGVSEITTQSLSTDASSSSSLSFPFDADYYVLTVSTSGTVVIDLTSEDTDVFLNMYSGKTLSAALSKDPLVSQDDISIDNTNARLEVTLSSGSYILEAGAYGVGSYQILTSTKGVSDDRVGPVALDLNAQVGDQSQRQTTQLPKAGDIVTLDLVATEGGDALSGFQVVVSYNPEELQFSEVIAKDLFAGAVPLSFDNNGKVTINTVFLGSTVTPRESGSLVDIKFEVLEGFSGETGISLVSGEFAKATEIRQLDIGGGGALVTIGGELGGDGPPSPDFNGDGFVGFPDFLAFAQAFGSNSGDANYDVKFDLNSDGNIGFPDFLTFASAFGKPVGGKPVLLSKPAKGQKPGVNHGAGLSLSVPKRGNADQVWVVVGVNNITHLSGYSLRLDYDPTVLEPVEVVGLEGSAFQSPELSGVALQSTPEAGHLILADVLRPESALTEDGELVTLKFHVLNPTAIGRVDVVEAIMADGVGHMNVLGGAFVDGIRPIPTEFALDQNYPNPFNPETIIRYQLPESGDVALMIYNILGQEIRTLFHEPKDAGYYQAIWDGKDTAGHSVSSGVYFYRLITHNQVMTKRMLLLK